MFQTKTSRVLAALLVLPLLLSIQGCTDDEVLETLGGIAIVGGAVAIGVTAGDDCCHGGGGFDHGPRGGGFDHGGPRGGGRFHDEINVANLANASDANSTETLNRTSQLAQHYGVTFQAAAQMQSAMNTSVAKSTLQPLYDIGLSRTDIETFGQMKMISNAGLQGLSQKLNITGAQASHMVTQMIIDVRLQAADVTSDFWKSCMNTGSWKTPENSSCKSTDEAGCSPQSGATFCAAN